MSAGDIIQIGTEFYMVKQIGVKKINLLWTLHLYFFL
jgi:hypothetical protein